MFNKNTPVIDFDNDHDNFWGDEDASIEIAKNLSSNVITMDSEQRKQLHVAAVFACNFSKKNRRQHQAPCMVQDY